MGFMDAIIKAIQATLAQKVRPLFAGCTVEDWQFMVVTSIVVDFEHASICPPTAASKENIGVESTG